jgi:hypothetical protein
MQRERPSCAVNGIELLSRKRSLHHNRHVLYPCHAPTPTQTRATRHPRQRIQSRQTPHTAANEAEIAETVGTDHQKPISPSPDIPTLLANPSQSKNRTEALRHQTGAHQAPCNMGSGWPAHRRTSVMGESGFPPRGNEEECIIHQKRGRGHGNDQVGDIIRTMPVLRAPILGGTEIEREKGTKRRKHHLHKKLADGRRI